MATNKLMVISGAGDQTMPPAYENYTYVNGIYSAQIVPLFSNAPNNVQQPVSAASGNEEAYSEQPPLRFFTIQ